jgi:hypothetical protein
MATEFSHDNLSRLLVRVDSIHIAHQPANGNHDIVVRPREMVHFIIGATVPRPLLVAARETAGAGINTSANLYFFYDYITSGYFGSCHCSFIFATDHNDSKQEYGAHGHVIVQFMEIPWGTQQPTPEHGRCFITRTR